MKLLLLSINIMCMNSTPLILAGLGGVFSERSGIVNIGLEGMMTIGAFIAVVVTYYTNNPYLGLLCSGVGAGIFGALHAFYSVKIKGNQTISGIAINFIASGVALFFCRLLFGGSVSTPVVNNKLPKVKHLLTGLVNSEFINAIDLDFIFIFALFLTFLSWFILNKTKWGMRITSVGEHPMAASSLGIDVCKTRYVCVILSGVLAGFGGAAMSISVVSQFNQTVISGHGYIALAAVIFGKWTPLGTLGACLLFAFFQSLSILIGGSSYFNIPTPFLSILPYVLAIVVLMFILGKFSAPASLGVVYEREGK